jgi:hypothetical protein
LRTGYYNSGTLTIDEDLRGQKPFIATMDERIPKA